MWSWLLACVGICGIALVGLKSRRGWLVLILNEAIWVVYALRTAQYGFILMAATYLIIYVHSFRKWGEAQDT